MKILITGHRGFVGRHFVSRIGNDADITGVDIKDGTDCRDFFRSSEERFDLVIHLAAIVGGRMSIEGDPLAVATDLSIDAEMFNWAVRTGQQRVIYFSSSAAYPVSLQHDGMHLLSGRKLRESDIDLRKIANPDMTYGWAKLTGEMLADYARGRGVAVHVFRPFSGYGEDQDLDYPFPSFIARAKRGESPFTVWGDGEQVRDFIHVDDIVDAALEAAYRGIDGPINLGSGEGTSFNRLARMVMEEAGYDAPIEHDLSKPYGVRYRVSSNFKMLEYYKPKISLREGIRKALSHGR